MFLSSTHGKKSDPDPVYVFRSGVEDVTALRSFNVDGKQVVISGSINGVVKFWDVVTKRPFVELQAGNGSSILYLDLLFTKDDCRIFVTHSRNGDILFWNADKLDFMQVKDSWRISTLGFCPINISKADDLHWWIAFPSEQSDVGLKAYPNISSTKEMTLVPKESKGMVMQLSLFWKEQTLCLLVGYEDGCLILYDALEGVAKSLLKLFDDPVMALSVDLMTLKIITGSSSNKLQLISINENCKMDICNTISTQFSGCSSACVRNDSKIVLVGGWDGKIRIYSWKKMKLLALLKYHTGTINCMYFDENKFAIVGSKDGKISMWDVYADK